MLKKLSIILTTGLLLFTIVTPVTADDSYVPSITAKDTVVIAGGKDENGQEVTPTTTAAGTIELGYTSSDGCDVKLVLTPYSKRSTITTNHPFTNTDSNNRAEESLSEINNAWSQIQAKDKVVDYAPIMKEVAEDKGIDEDDLVTKDLFDITIYHSGENDSNPNLHNRIYNIQLTTEALKNFVALLHYKSDGTWELVSDARVTGDNKDILTFSFDSCSPFAIIVKKTDGQGTGGSTGTTDKDSSVPNTAVRVVDTIRNASVASYFLWILLVILAIVVTYILNNHNKHEKKR